MSPSTKLPGGALAGDRPRVLISSDIGGSDDDDFQSFVHYLVYADVFNTEGIVSSPPHGGRVRDILKVIDLYEKDLPQLRAHSRLYPNPDQLRAVTKQGAINPSPKAGFSKPTEGSRHIIRCAKRDEPRPLWVLVWGSITDVAQALHDAPEIESKIHVHFIASWNLKSDQHAARYIKKNHPKLWMIWDDSTFRGWYIGGEQDGDLGNKRFVAEHVRDHGALGDFMAPLKGGAIKMGDTPSVAYLLRGTPNDPRKPSWGGRYVKHPDRPNWFLDSPDPELGVGNRPGAKTVNRWRRDYLRDWQARMDRCLKR